MCLRMKQESSDEVSDVDIETETETTDTDTDENTSVPQQMYGKEQIF